MISGRGWCYQERLLSSQILHFTHFEVLHEDQKGLIQCQCGDDHNYFLSSIQRPILKGSKHPTLLWRNVVEQYTMRAFTKPWDILPGLAGIARRFQQYYQPGQYLAGLWDGDLAQWLCWKSVRIPLYVALNSGRGRCGVWPRRLPEPPPREDYVVPSFSWASRFGACEFLKNVWEKEVSQVVQIRLILCEPMDQNPFGRFTACAIEIRGLVLYMEVISTVDKDRKFVQGCRTEYADLIFPGVLQTLQAPASEWYESAKSNAIEYDFDATDDIPADGKVVRVFEMFRGGGYSTSLVLSVTEASQHCKRRTYRRIGICNIPSHHFNAASPEEIIVV